MTVVGNDELKLAVEISKVCVVDQSQRKVVSETTYDLFASQGTVDVLFGTQDG